MQEPPGPGQRKPLSPGELRLFEWARAGMLDAEIAVRLGTSNLEVKAWLEAIQRKLGVGSRSELRAWAGALPEVAEAAATPEMAAAPGTDAHSPPTVTLIELPEFDPMHPVHEYEPVAPAPAQRGATALLGLALLVGLVLAAWMVMRPGTGKPSADRVAAAPAGATSDRAAIPLRVGRVDVQPLRFGRDYDLKDYSMLVETGCGGCDAPPDGLIRVTRAGSGAAAIEHLFRAPQLPAHITSVTADRDGWRAAVTVCLVADCAGGAGGETAVYVSDDGGVTWAEAERISGPARARFFGREGLLLETWRDPLREDGALRVGGSGFRYLGGDDFVEPAPGAVPVGVLETGDIAWTVEGTSLLLDSTGRALRFPVLGQRVTISAVAALGTGRLYVAWTEIEGNPQRAFTGVVAANGEMISATAGGPAWSVVRVNGDHVLQATSLPSGLVPGDSPAPIVSNPIVVDLTSGEYRAVPNAFTLDPAYRDGRNVIRSYRRGPFVRVAVPEGECMAVLTQPGADKPRVACFARGVLLQESAPPRIPAGFEADGETWVQLSWPSGEGWARMDDLDWESVR